MPVIVFGRSQISDFHSRALPLVLLDSSLASTPVNHRQAGFLPALSCPNSGVSMHKDELKGEIPLDSDRVELLFLN